MSEYEDRLAKCIASAFPTLSDEEIRASNMDLLFDSDSMAGVTLIALIDEEFGTNVEVSELVELGSFAAVSNFLKGSDSPKVSL
jgi:acyl carrier protein